MRLHRAVVATLALVACVVASDVNAGVKVDTAEFHENAKNNKVDKSTKSNFVKATKEQEDKIAEEDKLRDWKDHKDKKVEALDPDKLANEKSNYYYSYTYSSSRYSQYYGGFAYTGYYYPYNSYYTYNVRTYENYYRYHSSYYSNGYYSSYDYSYYSRRTYYDAYVSRPVLYYPGYSYGGYYNPYT